MSNWLPHLLLPPLLVLTANFAAYVVKLDPYGGKDELSSSADLGTDATRLSLFLSSAASFSLLCRNQAACIKHAAHVLHWWEWNLSVCLSFLLCRVRNWAATNCKSSATRAKASTSVMAFTERVDEGSTTFGRGSRAQVSNSSPQKSPAPMLHELKKPVQPPLVVQES